MSKTAIIYWSGTGNTEAMANAIFDGAKEVNADTKLFSVARRYSVLIRRIIYDYAFIGKLCACVSNSLFPFTHPFTVAPTV